MATAYPFEIEDIGGGARIAGLANFTDPDNQPLTAAGPLVVPETGSSPLVQDTPEGDTLLAFNGDEGQFEFGQAVVVSGNITATGSVIDGGSLGPTIPYVTVQADAPTTYLTPIVVDTTAVTGATYAWDGSAYQKIADLLT